MREGYGSRFVTVWVCVSVTALAATNLVYTLKVVPLSFLWHVLDMFCMDFFENALFRSSGNIGCASLPSSLFEELSMNKRDSDGFFSRRLVYRSSVSSYRLTDSSPVTVDYQLRFLPYCVLNRNLLNWHARGSILHNCM